MEDWLVRQQLILENNEPETKLFKDHSLRPTQTQVTTSEFLVEALLLTKTTTA